MAVSSPHTSQNGRPASPPAALAPTPSIGLLSVDDSFERALNAADADEVRRLVRLPRLDLKRGEWRPGSQDWAPPMLGAVIVHGMLACNLTLNGRVSTELLGPGDVFTPWRPAEASTVGHMSWHVYEDVQLAVLNTTFIAAGRRWPALMAISHLRFASRVDRLAQRTAALQLPRVEDRILAVLWQLSDRFGRVCSEGITLQLPLTHQTLGQLVGAQRPTVTLALQALHDEGLLVRRDDGALLLPNASRGRLLSG